jgi:hypothetical protein
VDRFSTLGRLNAKGWFGPTERQKWASPAALSNPAAHLGLPALDRSSRALFEQALPRGRAGSAPVSGSGAGQLLDAAA